MESCAKFRARPVMRRGVNEICLRLFLRAMIHGTQIFISQIFISHFIVVTRELAGDALRETVLRSRNIDRLAKVFRVWKGPIYIMSRRCFDTYSIRTKKGLVVNIACYSFGNVNTQRASLTSFRYDRYRDSISREYKSRSLRQGVSRPFPMGGGSEVTAGRERVTRGRVSFMQGSGCGVETSSSRGRVRRGRFGERCARI